MTTLICPHCGTANRAGSNFCNKCGTDLHEEDAFTPPAIERAARRAADELHVHPANTAAQPPDHAGTDAPTPDEPADLAGDVADAAPPTPRPELPDQAPVRENPFATTIRGLLDPSAIVADPAVAGRLTTQVELGIDQERHLQQLMLESPPMMGPAMDWPSRGGDTLRVPWIALLLLLAVAMPLFFGGQSRDRTLPAAWPGVAAAFTAVEALPNGADVVVYWAVDPATAGEMDVVMRPVLEHLLAKEAQLTFISPLPAGPATAARLVRQTLTDSGMVIDVPRAARRVAAHNIYLPGGAVVLPLVGQSSVTPLDAGEYGAALRGDMVAPRFAAPALAVIVAPEAENVQHWLELVQPLNRVPAIAIAGAGVDPLVRPYLDSGQLRGLVSGYDGALNYRLQADRPLTAVEVAQVDGQLAAQNWGQLAIIALVIVGNLLGLLFRDEERAG